MAISKEWSCWIKQFFDELEIYEDLHSGTDYKPRLYAAVEKFLTTASEQDAEIVYSTFFSAYWIGTNENNPFLELVNKVKEYEQVAGPLIQNQRDHYTHAVYVFVFGLVIYQQTPEFRKIFYEEYLPQTQYKDAYTTNSEEFFYRWGLAALFHDIAYPLEVTIRQLNKYFNHSLSYGHDQWQEQFLDITGFSEYKKCFSFGIKEEYRQEFHEKYGYSLPLSKTDSCEIIAEDISNTLKVDYTKSYKSIQAYDSSVARGIIDHAYFGALICLRWHSALINIGNWNPAYFFFPVLDAASSIFLHNGYKHLFLGGEFELGPLDVKAKPIAFLLILSDTVQEWNRPNYGSVASPKAGIIDVELDFPKERNGLQICFVVKEEIDESILNSIEIELDSVLDIGGLFPKGIIFSQRKEEKNE